MSESNQQDHEKKTAQYEAENRQLREKQEYEKENKQYKKRIDQLRAKNSELRDKAIFALSSVATGWLITIRDGSDMSAFADLALFSFGSATFLLLLGYALIEKCTWVWDLAILASDENRSQKLKIGERCQKASLCLNYVAMAGALCGMIFLVAWKLGGNTCLVYGSCIVVVCAMIALWQWGDSSQKGKAK